MREPGQAGRARLRLSALLIVALGAIAYCDSLHGPFIFDDILSIAQNRSIRSLAALGTVLNPPIQAATAAGRPVLNLSLAVNYALGGVDPVGYHLFNLLVHLAGGLALFGIVRRTLLQRRLRDRFGAAALPLGLATAAVWVVHPLTTEAVTYTIQRAESLASLFYLVTLYAFIRACEGGVRGPADPDPGLARDSAPEGRPKAAIPAMGWCAVSFVSCLLGMGTKEIVVSAPVMVLWYDRTFIAGSVRAAVRSRRGYYAALAATWIPLIALVCAGGGNRSGTIGFGVPHAGAYFLTQGRAIVHYLALSLWPAPLSLDYGTFWEPSLLSAAPWVLAVLALAAGSLIAAWRNSPMGFLGLWFFALLAPTSLVPGTTQMIVEHRMYLALAAVIAAAVAGLYAVLGRRVLRLWPAAAALFVVLTVERNRDYRSVEGIWADTLRKRPEDATAQYNFANAIERDPARRAEAIAHFREALRLRPDFPDAHDSLGFMLAQEPGGFAAALAEYREAVRENPDDPMARNNLGNALVEVPGALSAAIEQLRAAERLNPDLPEVHENLGRALARVPGELAAAVTEYREAARLEPDAPTLTDLGAILAETPGGEAEAVSVYEQALKADPNYARAHNNLGSALMDLPGRRAEAVEEFRAATRLDPSNAFAHVNLGSALGDLPGGRDEAIAELRKAVALDPTIVGAHFNLGVLLGRDAATRDEAVEQFQIVLRLQPDYEPARRLLAQLQGSE